MAEAHECVIAAETTIDIVHLVLTADKTGGNNLGVWFFTLYYGLCIKLAQKVASLIILHQFSQRH
jgi:hypothetical protein